MKRYWPIALVALVGTALSANLVLLYLATSDPGFAVEPDYYAKALAWDEQRAQQLTNARLGWSLDLRVGAVEPDGAQPIEVRLVDQAARPVEGATVELTAFHNARSSDVLTDTLQPQPDGTYVGSLRFRRSGLWEFRLTARRGDDVFTDSRLEELWARPPLEAGGGT